MTEFKSSKSPQEETTRRAVLVVQSVTLIAILFTALGVYLTVQTRGAWQAYQFIILAAQVIVTSFVSASLIRRGRSRLGSWIIFISNLIAPIWASLLVSRLGYVALAYILVTTYFTIRYVIPKEARRIAVVLTAFGLVISFLAEMIDPAWRLVSSLMLVVSPILTGFLGVVFIAVIARQAWAGNIRNKLMVAFIGVTVVATGVLGAFMYITTSNNLRDNLERELSAQAIDRATRIGDLFNEQINTLTTLSLNEVMLRAVAAQNGSYGEDSAAIQTLLDTQDAQWRAADAADNNNDPLVRQHLSNAVSREVSKYKQTFPDNVEVFVTDVYGGLVGSTNRTSDYYQADEGWWQVAYNEGQGGVYISDPEFDESAGAISVLIALPLRDSYTGEITGILRTTYILSPLTAILTEKIGQTGEADLFFPGEVVSHIHAGDFEQVEATEFEALQAVAGQGMVEMDYEGEPSVVTQAKVQTLIGNPFVDSLGWVVVLHQDRNEAFASINEQVRGLIIVLAIVVALAVAAAYFLSLLLIRPILRLTTTAEEVSAGNLDSRAQITTADEVGTLATAFNTMTSQLQETLQGLEQRVADRTRNLELAAEVGRSVSQVRALDVMLKDACQLILEQFDLYYVQVYLTNPSQTELQLQAGTGEVGAQLRERGHRLPLNTGSINGRAAIEKHAVVISDTAESATFRPNELLPDTRGEMAVPLIVGDEVVGVLDMQSSQPGVLNEEVLLAFEALAGQLAIGIQNARLLAEAEQALDEVETQARRQIRASWREHLDAIHKPEHFGFVFDRNDVTPLDEADELPGEGQAVSAPISLTGEELGSLVVELAEGNQNGQTDLIVNTVARQVAQQIENLRLLESAERYRREAEQVLRRQTRESWREYANTKSGESLGYLYDLNEVRPYSSGDDAEASALTLPLKVRDETVGKLAIQGLTPDDEDSLELASAIAERLGTHIEGLRLTQQIQSRAQREQALRQITNAVRSSTDLTTILRTAVRELGNVMGRRAVIRMAMPEQSAGEEQVPDKNGSSENADGGMNS